jgi:hypothetical protein
VIDWNIVSFIVDKNNDNEKSKKAEEVYNPAILQ